MIRLLKNIYESVVSSFELKTFENQQYRAMVKEASDFVLERPTDGGFIKIDQDGLNKGHKQENQMRMIEKARLFYRTDPHARGILDTLVHYTMGRGLTIEPKSEDPMNWFVWKEFWNADRNKMQTRQFEITLRLFRDGEVFLQTFSRDDEGGETGKTTVRFLDPLQIKNPLPVSGTANVNENMRAGIETDPNDVEKVIAYHVQDRRNINKFERIDAANVIHLKIYADSDQMRGETFLQTIMPMFTNYQQWLENRIILNKMRTAIVMIRKVEGTPSQVQNVADNVRMSSNVRAGEQKRNQIRGGTVLTASPGVSYEMLSPNINATDVKEDGRNIKLAMAAGSSMPEYIFGDASNANYASTLVAESPFVKAIEYWQIYLEWFWNQLYKKVVGNAVNAGVLTAPSDDEFLAKLRGIALLDEQEEPGETEDEPESPREQAMAELMPEGKIETPTEIFYGVDIQWPEIQHRDIKALTDSLMIARTNGWISDPTASSILGYDYAEEVRKQKQVEEEAEAGGNPLLGKDEAGDDGEMEREIADLLTSMTPEEKQRMLNSNNPQDIAAMLLQRVGAGNGNGTTPPPSPAAAQED